MHIVLVANQKGGTGKTSISLNLAHALALSGKRVIGIDADPGQESLADWASLNEGAYFDVVAMGAVQLKAYVERNAHNYDIAIIDCPPRANRDAGLFIRCADFVLIPVQPSPFDVWALEEFIEIIRARQTATDGKPDARIVLSMKEARRVLVAETLEALKECGLPVMASAIHRREIYRQTAAIGQSVLIGKSDEAKEEVEMLAQEILFYLENPE